jgi:hypothetical protein
VDPLADIYSPVASFAIGWGDYYSGLTRDDVAGLRYLLSTNNVNWETAPSGSLLGVITTNTFQQQFPPDGFNPTNGAGFYYFNGNTNGGYGYGDLAALIGFSRTNNLASLQAAYPGIIISSYSNAFVRATNITYSYYITNLPYGSTYPPPTTIAVAAITNGYWQQIFYYQFANVFTNHYYTNTTGYLQTISVSPPIGSPYGSAAVTNITSKATNQISGDFFVLPLFQAGVCPLDIFDGTFLNVRATTNYLNEGSTNFVTATNLISLSNSVALVTYFTNYSFIINPVTCTEVANATGSYEGVKNIKFVRADYDSLTGQYWQPVTNDYTMVVRTNSQAVIQRFRRVVTRPDFLFSAEDLTAGPAAPPVNYIFTRNLNFDTANLLNNLAGPGTITPAATISFNKAGPVYFNTPSSGMDGTPYFNQTPGGDISDSFYNHYFVWAAYDGTTNAPVVFPNGSSIASLENQMLIQVFPGSLPGGFTDTPYPAQTFTATGGSFTAPYTWSALGLPAGLSLSSGGTLSGTPTQSGTFDFKLTLTDYVGRSVQWTYPITIQ